MHPFPYSGPCIPESLDIPLLLPSFLFSHFSPSWFLHITVFGSIFLLYTFLFPTDSNFPEIHYQQMLLLGQKFFTKVTAMKTLWISFNTLPGSPSLGLLFPTWSEHCNQIGWPFVSKFQRQLICIHLKYQSFILFRLPGAHDLNEQLSKHDNPVP